MANFQYYRYGLESKAWIGTRLSDENATTWNFTKGAHLTTDTEFAHPPTNFAKFAFNALCSRSGEAASLSGGRASSAPYRACSSAAVSEGIPWRGNAAQLGQRGCDGVHYAGTHAIALRRIELIH